MKKRLTVLLSILCALSLPLVATAAMHEHGSMEKMEGMEHGKMEGMKHEGMEHGSMMMEKGMVMLGEKTEDGVKAAAHLNDVKEAMAKMGMKETHHFMVMFMDAKTGEPITEGTVAVKIEGPAGKTSDPVKLMGMEGHFGADIVLAEKGKYEFKVGTKLRDGQKRQYEFEYENK
jgi:hypothetical protein